MASSPSSLTGSFTYLISSPLSKCFLPHSLSPPLLTIVAKSPPSLSPIHHSHTTILPAILPSRRTGPNSSNFDDDGVIRHMETYLNDLSLEYDSVWDTKPAWCQPWTIVLTGLSAITGSWLLWHMAFVTTVVTLLTGIWWFAFLYSYPRVYAEMIAKRRQRVSSGDEDTFGTRMPKH